MFSYGNITGTLGEHELPWEHKPWVGVFTKKIYYGSKSARLLVIKKSNIILTTLFHFLIDNTSYLHTWLLKCTSLMPVFPNAININHFVLVINFIKIISINIKLHVYISVQVNHFQIQVLLFLFIHSYT